jgi:hypothetical protein
MWWLWAAFTLLFILAHLAVTQVTKLPFREAFRIARAGAAVVLTGVGFYTLYQWLPFASTTYVLPTPDPFATTLVAIPLAHFAADFVLMPMGWFLERERPRPDLLIHHGAAVTTALLTLRFTIAAPLYLLLLPGWLLKGKAHLKASVLNSRDHGHKIRGAFWMNPKA